jgi:hypothetical protein
VVRSSGGALLYLRGTPIGHGMEVARDVISALLPAAVRCPSRCTATKENGLNASPVSA